MTVETGPSFEEMDERVAAFQKNLESSSDDMFIVRQAILHGSPFVLDDEGAFVLANEIAGQYGVHPNRDIYVVGSAKLGFSISPSKRWRHFGDRSDIDVAVVSESLFVRFWNEIDEYIKKPTSWADRDRYSEYIASGWIRPDYLPVDMANEWFDFFRAIQRENRYGTGIKVAAGIYYSMSFLERYQATAVKKCRGEVA